MTPTRRPGFTLIELLVVPAILAVIATILFPVFAHVRERARQTTCASNLRQIGMAAMQYIADNNEMMVPVVAQAEGSGVMQWSFYSLRSRPLTPHAGVSVLTSRGPASGTALPPRVRWTALLR